MPKAHSERVFLSHFCDDFNTIGTDGQHFFDIQKCFRRLLQCYFFDNYSFALEFETDNRISSEFQLSVSKTVIFITLKSVGVF